ncbi:MAG: hypothetical protein RMK89_10110 [Armatimonadota bacterium]|nr:hypothetical protein [Armatimonadota bacterium]MDW8143802.1 hypothetical protein [Armatimonadota bacterium]
MPTTHEHVDKAEPFERVLLDLDDQNPDHWDWITVIAFYAALHWVDAFLATQNRHSMNHRARNQSVAFLPFYGDYGELYVLSRQARYEAGHLEQDEAIRARDFLLSQIRQWVQQQISSTP